MRNLVVFLLFGLVRIMYWLRYWLRLLMLVIVLFLGFCWWWLLVCFGVSWCFWWGLVCVFCLVGLIEGFFCFLGLVCRVGWWFLGCFFGVCLDSCVGICLWYFLGRCVGGYFWLDCCLDGLLFVVWLCVLLLLWWLFCNFYGLVFL